MFSHRRRRQIGSSTTSSFITAAPTATAARRRWAPRMHLYGEAIDRSIVAAIFPPRTQTHSQSLPQPPPDKANISYLVVRMTL